MSEHARRLAEALEPHRCDCARVCIMKQWMLPGDHCKHWRVREPLAAYRASDEYREDAERHAATLAGFQGLSDPKGGK